MALNRPEKGQLIQRVLVSGSLYHPAYAEYARYLTQGTPVHLERDPKNQHDSQAIKVCCGGHQIGWVPKHDNADLARRMDRGEQFDARVTSHLRAGEKYPDLQISIYAAGIKVTEAPELEPFEVCDFGKPSQDLDAFSQFLATPQGTVLRCISNANRASISLAGHQGYDLAWFRKSYIPDDLSALADQGLLKAQFMAPKSVFLFHAEDDPPFAEPKPPVAWREPPVARYVPLAGEATLTIYGTNTTQTTQKETTMNFTNATTTFINTNKGAFAQAGYLEAGRIANNQIIKLAGKSLPHMVRGYADTPVGKLVIANLAQMAAQQLRPQDPTLQKLTTAMTVAAYQEVIQTIDIECWLDQLLGTPEIKRAMKKLGESEDKA